jgi:radical SAM protein with 4Fe4S-binding SPASM domain
LDQSGLETIVDFWAEELQAGRWLFFSLLNKAIVWRELSQHGLVSTKNRRVPCGAGQKMLAINIHGDFFPCHRFIFYDKAQRQCMLGSLDSGLIDANQINKYTELDHSRLKAADQMCNECTQAQICHSLCPALNYALCNDIHSIDGRFCRFTKLEHLAVERLISQVGDIPKFRKYVDQLLKLYSSGVLSASVMAMFQRLADANPDEIAERAASIFDQLQHNRSKYPNPTQQ